MNTEMLTVHRIGSQHAVVQIAATLYHPHDPGAGIQEQTEGNDNFHDGGSGHPLRLVQAVYQRV